MHSVQSVQEGFCLTPFVLVLDTPRMETLPRVHVYDHRGRFRCYMSPQQAAEYVAAGWANRRPESDGATPEIQLARVLRAPSWVFGNRTTEVVRTQAGSVVYSPRRAASLLRPLPGPVSDLVAHGSLCLPIDRERRLRGLHGHKAAALVLHEIYGYSIQGIAAALDVSRFTAAGFLRSAIRELKGF